MHPLLSRGAKLSAFARARAESQAPACAVRDIAYLDSVQRLGTPTQRRRGWATASHRCLGDRARFTSRDTRCHAPPRDRGDFLVFWYWEIGERPIEPGACALGSASL